MNSFWRCQMNFPRIFGKTLFQHPILRNTVEIDICDSRKVWFEFSGGKIFLRPGIKIIFSLLCRSVRKVSSFKVWLNQQYSLAFKISSDFAHNSYWVSYKCFCLFLISSFYRNFKFEKHFFELKIIRVSLEMGWWLLNFRQQFTILLNSVYHNPFWVLLRGPSKLDEGLNTILEPSNLSTNLLFQSGNARRLSSRKTVLLYFSSVLRICSVWNKVWNICRDVNLS